jgi:hypothetical protein
MSNKRRKVKDHVVLRNRVLSNSEFCRKINAPNAFFAVEAEELHPESVVPNFLPDVEHRFHPDRPEVTIKEDGSPRISKLFPSNINNFQEYREAHFTGNNINTIVRGCKEHLPNRFCQYSHQNLNVFTIKASECTECPLRLVVHMGNHRGIPYKGTSKCRNTHQIKVTCWVPNGMKSQAEDRLIKMRNNIVDLVDKSAIRMPNGNGRSGGVGLMFSYGHKQQTEKYATIRPRPREKVGSKSHNNLDDIVKLTKEVCMAMSDAMTGRCFDTTVRKIKSAERGMPLTDAHRILSTNHPCPELGSRFGVSCKFFSTINFANEVHYDPYDISITFAYWLERYPGLAKNWYLVFPNMFVHKDGIVHKGLRIELCDGAGVEWDGRIMKHSTTISEPGFTEDGKVNDVMAVAFVATGAKLGPRRDIPYMRDPRKEMNSNYKMETKEKPIQI